MHMDIPGRVVPAVLYATYDGLLEPLGKSQVVAYLERLADEYAIHVVSFEKPADLARLEQVDQMKARLEQAGIIWHPLRYHKHPKLVSTLWDMGRAVAVAITIARRHRVRLFHARSLMSAAMVLPALRVGGGRLIFDIRGFWTDERVEGGLVGAGSAVERTLRGLERMVFRRADHIVTLTEASVAPLREDSRFGHPSAPITVIPTCADLDRFCPAQIATNDHPETQSGLTVGYVGQIGAWYRFDRMVDLFKEIARLRPETRMLVVNRSQQDECRRILRDRGVGDEEAEIVAADLHDVPGHIRRMDVAVVLMIDAFSNLARAPTKLAEYLGCGVPVIGNTGCGDMARIIEEDRVGVAMADTGDAAIEAAAAALLDRLSDPALPARCVASARRHFSLDEGAARYRDIYRSLAEEARS